MKSLTSRPVVHLWSRQLDLDREPAETELACLAAHERERARGFRHGIDRRRFVRRHRHLRAVLARYLGVAADRVPLEARLHQPPRLTSGEMWSDLRFSLSSSADRSAVALAWRRPVGVDIERVDSSLDVTSVAQNLFSRRECTALEAVSPDRRTHLFFRIWARKEAFVKALGAGFGRDLGSFDVVSPEDGSAPPGATMVIDRAPGATPRRFQVIDGSGPADFSLACCAEGDDWSIVSGEDDA